jgi:hypothetical protein
MYFEKLAYLKQGDLVQVEKIKLNNPKSLKSEPKRYLECYVVCRIFEGYISAISAESGEMLTLQPKYFTFLAHGGLFLLNSLCGKND